MRRVSEEEVERFLILYAQLKSYAAVGKACGRSADTVARHIKRANKNAVVYAVVKEKGEV